MAAHPVRTAAIAVLVIKLILLVLDPTPLFFLGDSQLYIDAAVYHNIPWSRSFTYGWLIRLLAVWTGTLWPLVVAQVLASVFTALILAFTLSHFFAVRPAVVILASTLFAVDPLQLLHERLILTETFTLCLFALNLLLAFYYLRRPGIPSLLAVCLTGIIIVSLRVLYVPVVLLEALLLPLLGRINGRINGGLLFRKRTFLLHYGVALLATLALHVGYRQLVGWLTGGRPAAYLHWDGLFLISAWAPLVQVGDATDPRVQNIIARQMTDPQLPLKDRRSRTKQLWNDAGLAHRLQQVFGGDWYATNQSAKDISRRVLRRDPLGVARLAWLTWLDYWRDPAEFRRQLLVEQGSLRPLPLDFLQDLKARFGFDASNHDSLKTLSRQMHLAGGVWYLFLLISPLICLVNVLLVQSEYRINTSLIATISLVLLLVTCVGAEGAYRYLHAFCFTAMLTLGLLTDAILHRMKVIS